MSNLFEHCRAGVSERRQRLRISRGKCNGLQIKSAVQSGGADSDAAGGTRNGRSVSIPARRFSISCGGIRKPPKIRTFVRRNDTVRPPEPSGTPAYRTVPAVGRCRCVVQRYEFLAVFVCRRKKLKNDARESKPIGRSECLPPRRNPPRRTARLILFATHCICPCLSVIFAFAQILPLGNVQINLTLHTLIRIFDCVLDTSLRKKCKRACFFLSAYSYLCPNK